LIGIVGWVYFMGVLIGEFLCRTGEMVCSMIVFVGKEPGFGFALHREGFIIWVS
jgi:hypothetical protein